jgi:hypothetical protein
MVWGGGKQARPAAVRGSCPIWFGTLSPSRDQGKKKSTRRELVMRTNTCNYLFMLLYFLWILEMQIIMPLCNRHEILKQRELVRFILRHMVS